MSAKKNWYIDPREIDRIMQKQQEEWNQKHIARVETKYGNTYISYGIYDYITDRGIHILQKLFELMGLECSMYIPFGEEKEEDRCFVSIKGEDQERATFIRKFIDNGYKLSWK